MVINSWLKQATEILAQSDIATARLDSEVLLADLLDVDKSWLHAHSEFDLMIEQIGLLNNQIERRKNHEPLAYIRGKQEFYGRDFFVSPDTLTPRPETETMIELLLESLSHESRVMSQDELQGTLCSEQGAKSGHMEIEKLDVATPTPPSTNYNLPSTAPTQIIDVGTGSGCIIITAALELMTHDSRLTSHFLGLDISKKALKIALKNAAKHKANVDFKEFDLRSDSLYSLLTTHYSLLILANLPYVPDDFHINLAASHEPPFAIFGGKDGLDYYRLLFAQLNTVHRENSKDPRKSAATQHSVTVFTESLPPQHEELEKIANAHGFALKKSQDFIQVFSNL